MKKMMLLLAPILLLAGIGYWFWSLASIQPIPGRTVELIVQQPGVQVRQSDADEWKEVTSGMRLEKGWSIKTDERGLATVRFFNEGESRLDHNSELTISEARENGSLGLNAEITLKAGRIWSRVLRLLDLNSSYEVRTSEVVATVRGTAFGMEKTATGTVAVSVAESAVTVASAAKPNGPSKAVAEGTVAAFASNGSFASDRPITNEERAQGWYLSNEMADQAFVKNEVDRRVAELKKLDGPSPDSPVNGIAALSERVHLSLASDTTRNVLLEQYLSRRLYHLIDLVEKGKTGLAAQEFSRIENDIQAQLQSKDGATNADYIRSAVLRISLLMEDSNPDDALYPFKQKTERLFETLSSSSELSRFYARMLAFDARLDEASRAISAGLLDNVRMMLDGVKSGLENIRRDSAPLVPTLSDDYRAAFEGKMSALEVREQAVRTRLDAALHHMIQPTAATSTDALLQGLGDGTATSTPAEESFISLTITASPSTIEIGQRAKLVVKGKRKDGTEKELTAFAQFVSLQLVGKLNGPSYTGTAPGKEEITARLQQKNGNPIEASVSVTVKGEVKLQDLVITSSVGTQLKANQKTQLTATARYTNGETKNVTDQTNFVIVSGNGSLNGTSFMADDAFVQATVAGTYTDKERNVTSIGSLSLIKSK
jgi:hypothetical protein